MPVIEEDLRSRPSLAESLLAAEKRTLQMMANGASLAEVLNDLCASIDDHGAPVTSMVCLLNGEWLSPCAGPNVSAAFKAAITPWRIGPDRASCGAAAFTKQRVIVPDISKDPRWPDDARDLTMSHGFSAAWSEPLISKDGEVLGTFAMFYPQPRSPQSVDFELIDAAGHIALIAIELERSHVALKNSENRLRTIIDTIPALAWSARPDGSAEFFNRRWLEYAGLSVDEAHDWGWVNAVHADDRNRLADYWRSILASGQSGEIEARLRRFDGVYRWFLLRASPLRDESGNIVKWYGTNADIDERKRAEEKLRRSEWNLLEAQRLGRTGSWSIDIASGTVTASPEMLRSVGFKPGEDHSSNDAYFKKMHPDDREHVLELFETCVKERIDFEADYRMLGDGGAIKYMHSIGYPVLSETGDVVEFVGAVIETTEQTRARIALEDALTEVKRLRDQLYQENLVLKEEIDQAFMFEEIVGSSPALKTVISNIVKVAPTDSTVLITGETGTGKELIARAIHKGSQRAGQPFVTVNCASIPSSLIASELFGHEKGAFTGALQRRQGRFELAHSGTIFLDEIGELPAETQIAILRVLQERQFERVGGNRVIQTDVRVIAATSRDLPAAIAAGAFRADLFYRLNVFPIRVPPLRNRKGDIPMLVEYFVKRYGEKARKPIIKIDKNTLKLCQSYDWPGNIRELQNIIERSVILCTGDTFWVDEAWLSSREAPRRRASGGLTESLHGYERGLIEAALADSHGKVAGPNGAAARLGIPRSTLDLKIKQLNIKKHARPSINSQNPGTS
jgi:PAS domain S-box-containing protein